MKILYQTAQVCPKQIKFVIYCKEDVVQKCEDLYSSRGVKREHYAKRYADQKTLPHNKPVLLFFHERDMLCCSKIAIEIKAKSKSTY